MSLSVLHSFRENGSSCATSRTSPRSPLSPPSDQYQVNHLQSPSPTSRQEQSAVLDSTPASLRLQPNRNDVSVDRVIQTLYQLKNGRLDRSLLAESKVFPLAPAQFTKLQNELSVASSRAEKLAAWYQDRARYDYDPAEAHYTLRMPTAVHECFTASFVNALDRAIADRITSLTKRKGHANAAIADALKRIFKGASTTVELDPSQLDDSGIKIEADEQDCKRRDSGFEFVPVRRSPDASFYHYDAAELPQLVVEVSYSQQGRHLSRLADSYIIDSRHAIRCVIGLDISYSAASPNAKSTPLQYLSDGTATISVWRPAVELDEEGDEVGVCRCDINAIPFRAADTTACEGSLILTLADLLPPAVLETLPASAAKERICLAFSELAMLLSSAERCQASMASRSPRNSPTSSPTKFRKRKRSPSQEISDERELAYLRQEAAEMKKDSRADRSWRSPSRRKLVWYPLEPRRSPRNKSKFKLELDAG